MRIVYDFDLNETEPIVEYPANVGGQKIIGLILAHNQADIIADAVKKLINVADIVLVVDNGSLDATSQMANLVGGCVIKCPEQRVDTAALSLGLKEACKLNPDVVLVVDVCEKYRLEEAFRLFAPILSEEADVVIGSGKLKNSGKLVAKKVWAQHIFDLVIKRKPRLRLSDPQSGFMAFSARALKALSCQSSNFDETSRVRFLSHKHTVTVAEVPVTVTSRKPKLPVSFSEEPAGVGGRFIQQFLSFLPSLVK